MTLSVPQSRMVARVFFAGFVFSIVSSVLTAQATKATSAGQAAPTSPFNGTVVEERVAQVNDQIISLSDYDRALQQVDTDGRQQGWTEQEIQDQKRNLLRDLIDKELLLSKGKELNITGETELVKRLDEIRKQNHLDSMEDLEKAAQEQGVSYEDFKEKIRDEIIINQVTREEVARHIQLTKAEVQNYYRQHKADFDQPESVHLQEILIPVAGDDAAALTAAEQKAADVEAKLKAGSKFEELAKQDSSGQTATTGGDLGDYKRGQLAKPIEDATFALKAGQVTQPIRTKQGLLILKVTQHVGGNSQDFNSIEGQVEEAAFMNRMQPDLRKYLTTLRTQAYLDIRPGYTDSGAASSAIKVLYTAYTPPGKKKAVKTQRTRLGEAGSGFRNKSKTTTQQATTAHAAGAAAATTTTTTTGANGATSTTTQLAAGNTVSTKPVKKQKVRFGQAPTGTLDNAPGNTATNVTSTDDNNGTTQIANNVSSNITGPGVEPAAAAAPTEKTRFSDRAKEKTKRVKPTTQDQLENQAQGQATPEEIAAKQTQSAPLGLEGDNTKKKKKQPKSKSDEKTRFADKPADKPKEAKPADESSTDAMTPAGTQPTPPAATPSSTPPSATPEPPGSAPPQ